VKAVVGIVRSSQSARLSLGEFCLLQSIYFTPIAFSLHVGSDTSCTRTGTCSSALEAALLALSFNKRVGRAW
jgi:hypothetical protein